MMFAVNNNARAVVTPEWGVYHSSPGYQLKLYGLCTITCVAAIDRGWLFIRDDILMKIRKITNGEKFSIVFTSAISAGDVYDNSDCKYTNMSVEGVPDEVIFH